MSQKKLSALLGDLAVPVRHLASDEGLLLERGADGLRVHRNVLAGSGGREQGGGGTDRHNQHVPRKQ